MVGFRQCFFNIVKLLLLPQEKKLDQIKYTLRNVINIIFFTVISNKHVFYNKIIS